ncbi:MAG: phosphoribosylanthranilate isomerase [Desulfovibrionaceae bacterium]|nr:phosphoribosylanthranilate isomerase [Desulfovibrionaceae bacterium]
MNRPLIKVCGLTRRADVELCQRLGADLMGFIFHPGSPRNTDPGFPAEIEPGRGLKVGVFVDQTPGEVLEIMDRAGLDLAQLHGKQSEAFCAAIGPRRVIKTLWPESYADARGLQKDLERFAPFCRHFLLDAGRSGGGHARSIDFGLIQHIDINKVWFLAGGLGPDNVRTALAACSPPGLDFNSGVEDSPGIKDPARLRAVFKALGRTLAATTEER